MRKRVIAKGNIHSEDHLRALVTDTMPGDVPIILSNDGFYKNCKRPSPNIYHSEFIERIFNPPKHYTMPYRYNIARGGGMSRKLSLIHPSGQLDVVKFYAESGHLICYYCRKSKSSIRSPHKVGSLFFIRGPLSEKNSLKKAGIDTVEIEKAVSNPASYFSYRGVDRAFKFFKSRDYTRLEKKYDVMCLADVAKCFSSIYTHTLFWATADVQTAKDNTQQDGFSNRFDKLMQSVNFNETNGICVGAEVSRVFAELILSEIDKQVINALENDGLVWKSDFEFRRYVDDFYIFASDRAIITKVLSALTLALSDFNLHLNEEKTDIIQRPFVTQKSQVIGRADETLGAFFGAFIRTGKVDEGSYSYPKQVRRSHSLLRSFLDGIKSNCFDNSTGYSALSNYVIGALVTRISDLILDYENGILREDVTDENYVGAIMLLLEAVYFVYNVDPTVPSSLRVAQGAIQSFNFVKDKIPTRTTFLSEQIVRWTFQFAKGYSSSAEGASVGCVPLEAINILLVLGEVGREQGLALKALEDFCKPIENLQYFEIVSYLFCLKGDASFGPMRDALFKQASHVLINGPDLRTDAQAAHLVLDILSCPYIEKSKRAKLFRTMRSRAGLSKITVAEAEVSVEDFEASPWFVQWGGANLLHMIRKKELSNTY